jgi:hypothetical protein
MVDNRFLGHWFMRHRFIEQCGRSVSYWFNAKRHQPMLVPGRKKPITSNGYGIFAAHEGSLFCRHPGSKARGEFSRQFIKKGLTAGG